MEIIKNTGLKTWNLGKYEGMPQTKAAQDKIDTQLIEEPNRKVSTGESFTEFFDRVIDAIDSIIKTSPGDTLVVTHNSVFGLIKVWNKYNRPDSFDKATREEYTKQDSETGDHYTIKGDKGVIYICRHGQTQDNVDCKFRTDETQLTDKGRTQAAEVGKQLSKVTLKEAVSSPLERAIETTNIILSYQKENKMALKLEKPEIKVKAKEEPKKGTEESKGLKPSDFLYMEPKKGDDAKTFATCGSCKMFLAKHNICSLHGKDVEVDADDSCGLYVKGGPAPESEMEHVSAAVTPEESGLMGGPVTCKNCEYFEAGDKDCLLFRLLNIKNYKVSPDGCCNAFSKGSED